MEFRVPAQNLYRYRMVYTDPLWTDYVSAPLSPKHVAQTAGEKANLGAAGGIEAVYVEVIRAGKVVASVPVHVGEDVTADSLLALPV